MSSKSGILTTTAASKTPQRLGDGEKWAARVLFGVGALLSVAVPLWFGIRAGGLVSKSSIVTGTTTTTTEYSDSIVIFGMAVGAALMLAGAFYARLREIRLGPVTVDVGDLPDEQQARVAETARAQVASRVADPEKQRALGIAAQLLAQHRARLQYASQLGELSDDDARAIATEAANRVIAAAAAGGDGHAGTELDARARA